MKYVDEVDYLSIKQRNINKFKLKFNKLCINNTILSLLQNLKIINLNYLKYLDKKILKKILKYIIYYTNEIIFEYEEISNNNIDILKVYKKRFINEFNNKNYNLDNVIINKLNNSKQRISVNYDNIIVDKSIFNKRYSLNNNKNNNCDNNKIILMNNLICNYNLYLTTNNNSDNNIFYDYKTKYPKLSDYFISVLIYKKDIININSIIKVQQLLLKYLFKKIINKVIEMDKKLISEQLKIKNKRKS